MTFFAQSCNIPAAISLEEIIAKIVPTEFQQADVTTDLFYTKENVTEGHFSNYIN